jgi:leader peptidase (prepilin peptidase) / N-methyltransferase
MILIALFFLFLGWGSFLNMLAYRLIYGGFDRARSFCPQCQHTIAWYDNIPLISWIMLGRKCRYCDSYISILYPFIELFTALSMTALWVTVPIHYFAPYFIFFSALIITIRTDFESMLISRLVTFFLVPIGWILSTWQYLPIELLESVIGSLVGYLFLWVTSKLFYFLTKKEGMGEGDIELLSFIGSFTGLLGAWMSLILGSLLGSVIGIYYMITDKNWRAHKIPFGPFLAFGAMIFVLTYRYLIDLILLSTY